MPINIYDYINNLQTYIFKKGEIVISENSPSNNLMYFLMEGQVIVTKNTVKGPKFLKTLNAGEYFGEMALVNSHPRATTVIADSKVVKCGTIDRTQFLKISQANPSFLFKMLKNTIERLLINEDIVHKLSLELEAKKKL